VRLPVPPPPPLVSLYPFPPSNFSFLQPPLPTPKAFPSKLTCPYPSISTLSPRTARFPPKLLYYIFITSDLLSLILQAVGGAISTSSSGASLTAIHIALAGLSLQVFTLAVFSCLMVDYLVRFSAKSAPEEAKEDRLLDGRMKTFLGALGAAILLILARCAFRVDELSEGYGGSLIRDEGLFIGLEGVLIVVATFLLCVGHPGFGFGKYYGKEVGDAEGVEFRVLRDGK
jgi:hypothetical protein